MPDPHYSDRLVESLRADVHRLEDLVRKYRDQDAQLNLNLARLADENLSLRRRFYVTTEPAK